MSDPADDFFDDETACASPYRERQLSAPGEGLADGRELAEQFHDLYERLAPLFGYETREETKKFDPESPNGRLMIAVCCRILATLRPPQSAQQGEWQWVPKEPTKEMLAAADKLPNSFSIGDEYRAMLSAAPSSPAVKGWAIKGPDGNFCVTEITKGEPRLKPIHIEKGYTCVPVLIVEDKR